MHSRPLVHLFHQILFDPMAQDVSEPFDLGEVLGLAPETPTAAVRRISR